MRVTCVTDRPSGQVSMFPRVFVSVLGVRTDSLLIWWLSWPEERLRKLSRVTWLASNRCRIWTFCILFPRLCLKSLQPWGSRDIKLHGKFCPGMGEAGVLRQTPSTFSEITFGLWISSWLMATKSWTHDLVHNIPKDLAWHSQLFQRVVCWLP